MTDADILQAAGHHGIRVVAGALDGTPAGLCALVRDLAGPPPVIVDPALLTTDLRLIRPGKVWPCQS